MNKQTPNKQQDIRQAVIPYLYCSSCGNKSPSLIMLGSCPRCSGALQYLFEGSLDEGRFNGRSDHRLGLWKYFDLLPLQHPDNIVSLDEGYSEVIELSELSDTLRGAKLFIKLDCTKNPTGTFKDRE